jgi:hypothetical protein
MVEENGNDEYASIYSKLVEELKKWGNKNHDAVPAVWNMI